MTQRHARRIATIAAIAAVIGIMAGGSTTAQGPAGAQTDVLTAVGPAAAAAAGRVPGVLPLPTPEQQCPAGTTRDATLAKADFEDGQLPPGAAAVGWTVRSAPDAPQGSSVASGVGYAMDFTVSRPLGMRVYATFWVRGTGGGAGEYGAPNAILAIRDPEALTETTWMHRIVDLTDADRTADGRLTFKVQPYAKQYDGDWHQVVQLDDVVVYTCTNPVSKARGDFDSDGRSDVPTVLKESGVLWMVTDTTYGWNYRFHQVFAQFTGTTWLGSPGDVTGDGRSDLLARDAEGRLWMSPGDGAGGFDARVQVGVGWQSMTAIVPMGDITGDGRSDVLARDPAGRLFLYSFAAGGRSMGGGSQVGNGWQGFPFILQAGDMTGDGRTDLLAVDSSGQLWAYEIISTGRFSGRRTLLGTGWFFARVSGIGDTNGDGHEEIYTADTWDEQRIYDTLGPGRVGGWRRAFVVYRQALCVMP